MALDVLAFNKKNKETAMNHRRGIRSLCRAALAVTALSLSSSLLAAEEVKIGFLVKQAEEPWFQTEWAFAEKAGKDRGFTVIKIAVRSEEHTSELQSLMRISYAVFCLKKKNSTRKKYT